jgi:alpha-L-fucosidase 2
MGNYNTAFLLSKSPSSFMGNPFLDSSVIGSGRVGVAVLGAVANEQILINHGALRGRGKIGVLQDIGDEVNTVRKYVTEGKIVDAEKVMERALQKRNCNLRYDQPLPMAKIKLDFPNSGVTTDYQRITDMERGEIEVSFNAGDVHICRQLSVSKSTDIIAYHISSRKKNSVAISIEPMDKNNKYNFVKYESGYLYFSGRAENGRDYGIVVRVVLAGGIIEKQGDGVVIKAVDEVTLFIKPFVNGDKDDEFDKIKIELSGIKESYDKVAGRNAAAFKRAFENVSLSLPLPKDGKDIHGRITEVGENILSADLLLRLWNFARYILVCCDGEYLTPAGLWCADMNCDNGMLAFSGTAQLLYSGLTKSINPDAVIALLNRLMKYESDLRKNSARVYGMRGYFVPNTIAPDSAIFGDVDAGTLHFIASGALASSIFYNYYLATGDEKTLRGSIFPFMREVFDFYSNFLKLDNSGKYQTVPSYSPFSTPANLIGGRPLENFRFAINSTIDFIAIKTLLYNLIDTATVLNIAKSDIAVWQDMLSRFPVFSVAGDGAIKEYTNSVFVDKLENAGVMHGYGLYPLKNFVSRDHTVTYRPNVMQGSSPDAEIAVSTASANAVKNRAVKASNYQTTANLAMAACQLAYAGDSHAVHNLLLQMVGSSVSPSGLFLSNDWRGSGLTANGRVNLDIASLIGFATAVTECIIGGDNKVLRVLPILFDGLEAGEIKNIAVDFAATVSLSWDAVRGKCNLKIMPKQDATIDIVFNDVFGKCKDKSLVWDKRINGVRGLKLTAGKTVSISI